MSEFELGHLPLERIGVIKPLLEQNTYKPMRYLARELNNDLTEFWFALIIDLVQSKNAKIFAAFRKDEVVGLLVYADNPWETAILNKGAGVIHYLIVSQPEVNGEQIAQILLEKAVKDIATHGTEFLLCKPYVDASNIIHALESQGFLLMDTLVDCYYDFRRFPFTDISQPAIPEGIVLRLATHDDVEELVTVARKAFQGHFGRYHADERIGGEQATHFYEEWIKSSMSGYADWICVAETTGRIIGYSIWKNPSPLESEYKVRVAHYSIAGIHPDYSRRGLFTALTYEGMRLLEGQADIIEGPTHINNHGVQTGYSNLHWRVCVDARHSFHRWL